MYNISTALIYLISIYFTFEVNNMNKKLEARIARLERAMSRKNVSS